MADAAVVEKVSNAPSAPSNSMLSGEKLQEFSKAIEADRAEFAAPPAEKTPAPETTAPPSESTRTETVEAVPPPVPAKVESAPPPAAATPPPAEELGPIPYERFREVNETKNRVLAEKADLERRMASEIQKNANEMSAKKLLEIAEQYPELAPIIFGRQPQNQPPKPPTAPVDPSKPLDPIVQQLQTLEKRVQTQEGIQQRQEQAKIIADIESRADSQMEKHQVFKEPSIRQAAEEIIVNHILTRPHIPPEKIVDDVAAKFKAIEQGIKAQYEEKKKAVLKSVAPGVGQGAPPAPPGPEKKKLRLGDGSALKALAAAMGAQRSGT